MFRMVPGTRFLESSVMFDTGDDEITCQKCLEILILCFREKNSPPSVTFMNVFSINPLPYTIQNTIK
jgi:hypothetical protein